MSYRIVGLSPEPFLELWPLDDARLAERNIRRVQADSDRGYPCRISLEDARQGEELLLLPYRHHAVAGPYRASGPIFIRRSAQQAAQWMDEVPPAFQRRLLSVRGYDAQGWMQACEVVEGTTLDAHLRQCLQRTDIAYLHVHNARPGCFAARVERA